MMESRETEKSTPKKTMHDILYEQVHGKFAHSTFNNESPFRSLPNYSTPPSRLTKVINPFEPVLSQRLQNHLPVFSPSVFNSTAVSRRSEDKFKWTIDNISSLKPADIDITSTDQYENTENFVDAHTEEKMNTYFSEKLIVPSPLNMAVKCAPLLADSPEQEEQEEKTTANVLTQTLLSLPPILPKQVEEALKPYFTHSDTESDQKSPVDMELYDKLFGCKERSSSPDSIHTSPAISVAALSPIQFSPFHCHDFAKARKSREVMGGSSPLRDCDISPIRQNSFSTDVLRSSTSRLNFTSYMSVESVGCVPDNSFCAAEKSDHMFEAPEVSPPLEPLNDSTINWDMEYKHISLESNESSPSGMDVSGSNTPRSRFSVSQRKIKLSDSFLRDENSFENKENDMNIQNVPIVKNLFSDNSNEATDVGYQTASIVADENSDSWERTHLFASTPTKIWK